MAYEINICLLGIKCKDCKHCRPDPKRYGESSCYLNEDLQGKERLEYLERLKKHLQTT